MTIQHIAIFSGKGGVGKSTIAVSLAQHSGYLLVDADPQCSAAGWGEMRDEPTPPVKAVPLAQVLSEIERSPSSIIDMPGSLSSGGISVLKRVDLILVLTNDHQFELDALSQSVEIAQAVGKRVVVLLNRIHPFSDPKPVMRGIEQFGAQVCPVVIRDRSPHYKALREGKAAAEFEPGGAAATEIASLWAWIEELA